MYDLKWKPDKVQHHPTTAEYLGIIDHCLDGLRTEDPRRDQEIDELKEEVASLVGLCIKGLEVVARAGIDLIAPRVEALVKYPDLASLADTKKITIIP